MAMQMILAVKDFVEYVSGQVDQPPANFRVLAVASPLWGLWWGFLSFLIFAFCGQASKFIYIDF
jgi:hypothetical protein